MPTDQSKYGTKLANTTVLITGGTSGLGFGVAEALLEQITPPAHIMISSSNAAKVDKAVERLRKAYPNATKTTKLTGVTCNLGDELNMEANIAKLFQDLPLDGKKLDHIVHTAGDSLAITKLADIDMAAAKKAGMVRYFAPLFIAKHAAKYMPASPDASITLTGGGIADRPQPGWFLVGGYAAGLQALSRGLARELKPIRVNLVQPGAVDTELWGGLEDRKAVEEALLPHMATGRIGRVEDVVEGFLMCMRDGNVTGSILRSDGGHTIA